MYCICLESYLDDADKQLNYSEKYNEILNIQELEALRYNIYYGFEELNKDNIALLTKLLNIIYIEEVILIQNENNLGKQDDIFTVYTGIDIDNHKGLLWTREIDNTKQIKGLHQVVGRTPQEKLEPKLENGIIKADTLQSNGYNIEFSNATLLNFKYDQCQVKIKKNK